MKELIRVEADQSLSFGDYSLDKKAKVENFDVEGDLYKLKTFCEMTKLDKNGILVFESLPGSEVTDFKMKPQGVTFKVESKETVNITIELAPNEEYKIFIDQVEIDRVKANLSGKITFSLEESHHGKEVKILQI